MLKKASIENPSGGNEEDETYDDNECVGAYNLNHHSANYHVMDPGTMIS